MVGDVSEEHILFECPLVRTPKKLLVREEGVERGDRDDWSLGGDDDHIANTTQGSVIPDFGEVVGALTEREALQSL